MLAPIAPAPAIDDSSHRSSSDFSSGEQRPQGTPDVLAHRHAEPAEAELRRRLEREALQRRPHLSHVARALPDEPGHELREDRSQPRDRAGGPALEPAHDERLRPHEHVEPRR